MRRDSKASAKFAWLERPVRQAHQAQIEKTLDRARLNQCDGYFVTAGLHDAERLMRWLKAVVMGLSLALLEDPELVAGVQDFFVCLGKTNKGVGVGSFGAAP